MMKFSRILFDKDAASTALSQSRVVNERVKEEKKVLGKNG